MTDIAFPYRFDGGGRTAQPASTDHHIRELVEQVLFTSPGERVNRPTFGTGLAQLVFAPNSQELATATQFLVQAALQQTLGDLIHVETIQVNSVDSTLSVTVQYVVLQTQQRQVATFAREAAS
jgi:phage baseplate assembly protein W